jgi:hypothetical protein
MRAPFSSPVIGSLRLGTEAASAADLKAHSLNIIVKLTANFAMDLTLQGLLFSESLELAVVNF